MINGIASSSNSSSSALQSAPDFACQTLHCTPRSNVREPNSISQRDHQFVPPRGQGTGYPTLISTETGQHQQPPIRQCYLPFRRNAYSFQTPCGTEDDGLAPAQQDAETFSFHRRMKTADNAAPGVPPAGRLVVAAQNRLTGTTGRAEQRRLGTVERREAAQGGQVGRHRAARKLQQACRVARVVVRNGFKLRTHGWLMALPRPPEHAPLLVEYVFWSY